MTTCYADAATTPKRVTLINRLISRHTILSAVTAGWLSSLYCSVSLADDNLIAHQLYRQGRFAEAAEIFTDPAWKGVALYRSDQWWRAAEAFVRADDAVSMFNLGNSYIKLGYYALALDAFLAAIKQQPDFPDAVANADLMRLLLQQSNQSSESSALQRQGDVIEQIDTAQDDAGNSGSGKDNDDSRAESQHGEDREGDTDARGATPDAIARGDSREAGSDATPDSPALHEGGTVRGTATDAEGQSHPAGRSEADAATTDSLSAGTRAQLETEQATEQWLNSIGSSTERYLKAQIELEARRRRANGQAPPGGGSQW